MLKKELGWNYKDVPGLPPAQWYKDRLPPEDDRSPKQREEDYWTEKENRRHRQAAYDMGEDLVK